MPPLGGILQDWRPREKAQSCPWVGNRDVQGVGPTLGKFTAQHGTGPLKCLGETEAPQCLLLNRQQVPGIWKVSNE